MLYDYHVAIKQHCCGLSKNEKNDHIVVPVKEKTVIHKKAPRLLTSGKKKMLLVHTESLKYGMYPVVIFHLLQGLRVFFAIVGLFGWLMPQYATCYPMANMQITNASSYWQPN